MMHSRQESVPTPMASTEFCTYRDTIMLNPSKNRGRPPTGVKVAHKVILCDGGQLAAKGSFRSCFGRTAGAAIVGTHEARTSLIDGI